MSDTLKLGVLIALFVVALVIAALAIVDAGAAKE